MHVLTDDLQRSLVGAHGGEGFLHRLVLIEEELVDEVVDVGVIAADGPVDRTGGHALTLGSGEDIFHLPVPLR